MVQDNSGCPFDLSWFGAIIIDNTEIEDRIQAIKKDADYSNRKTSLWLQSLKLTDLTTLNGDDTEDVVKKLCAKAKQPIPSDILAKLVSQKVISNDDASTIHTAAVCVYPNRVVDAKNALTELGMLGKIQIASVAAGFPSGQYPLKSRLIEIECCIEYGATEIDVVIDRSLVLTGKWQTLYDEIKAFKQVCAGRAHLKTILAVGELGTLTNVYKASMIAMMAGSDFIKTSTGKETVNATLQSGLVMCRAILDYESRTGVKVGFKPAGGIRTATDSLEWLHFIETVLGDAWLVPSLFRFGASGLVTDLVKSLAETVQTV